MKIQIIFFVHSSGKFCCSAPAPLPLPMMKSCNPFKHRENSSTPYLQWRWNYIHAHAQDCMLPFLTTEIFTLPSFSFVKISVRTVPVRYGTSRIKCSCPIENALLQKDVMQNNSKPISYQV